jgi:hypothetical protein
MGNGRECIRNYSKKENKKKNADSANTEIETINLFDTGTASEALCWKANQVCEACM